MEYKDKSILVWGNGLDLEHAVRISKDVKHVDYFTPFIEKMKYVSYAIGENMAPNLTKVKEFEDYVNKADLIMFCDIGGGGRAKNLRNQGKLVFGGGDGEKFEEYRYNFRLLQEKAGLPTQKTKMIKGIDALRAYAQKNRDFFVKHDIFRGDFESLPVKSYESTELEFDEIDFELGPARDTYEFMVEPKIDGVMCGIDGFCNGNDFLWPMMYGWEDGSGSYIGKVCNSEKEMLPQLNDLMGKIIKLLRIVNYRGAISIEVILTSDGKYFPIDMTMRFAYPLSITYTEYIENYTEVIFGVAMGEKVVPIYKGKYIGCLASDCPHAKDYWIKLMLPEKLRKNIKLQYAAKYGRDYYLIKGFGGGVLFINNGNSVDEVFKPIKHLAEKFDAKSYDSNLESLWEIQKTIKKATQFGINF